MNAHLEPLALRPGLPHGFLANGARSEYPAPLPPVSSPWKEQVMPDPIRYVVLVHGAWKKLPRSP